MAEENIGRMQSLYYPFLCTGQFGADAGRTLPDLTGVPGRGQTWLRTAFNMTPMDGHLRRSPAVRELSPAGGKRWPQASQQPGAFILQIHQFLASPFLTVNSTSQSRTTARFMTVVVTTKNIVISSLDSTWTTVNPYWIGTSGRADPTFTAYDTFVREFNGDLYIGSGQWHRNVAGSTVQVAPAVLKISNFFRNGSFGDPDYSWVVSGGSIAAPTAYGGCENLGGTTPRSFYWNTLCGMEFLQDGRLVLLGASEDPTSATVTMARVFYSSHLDITEWNTSPGGWVDVVANPGAAHALSKLGSSIHIHYADAIVAGEPTGQDDPPLYFRPTQAGAGTPYPQSIRAYEGTILFVDANLNLQRFNGQSSQIVSDYLARQLRQRYDTPYSGLIFGGVATQYNVMESIKTNGSFSIDRGRSEYRVVFPIEGLQLNTAICASIPLRPSIGSGEWAMTLDGMTTLSDTAYGSPELSPQQVVGPFRRWISGLAGWYPASTGRPMLSYVVDYAVKHTATDLSGVAYQQNVSYYHFETDDLDFEAPGFDKTISHLSLWLKGDEENDDANDRLVAALPTITVYASRNGMSFTNYADNMAVTKSVTENLTAKEQILHFFFPPKAAERWRFLIKVNATAPKYSMPYIFTRMKIHYQVQGEVEPVD